MNGQQLLAGRGRTTLAAIEEATGIGYATLAQVERGWIAFSEREYVKVRAFLKKRLIREHEESGGAAAAEAAEIDVTPTGRELEKARRRHHRKAKKIAKRRGR